jgi:Protein of unknown function (DUF3750)
MRRPIKKIVLTILAIFLFPLAVHGALYYSVQNRPQSYDHADWSSTGMLPAASAEREARLLIFTGRTGRWKGIFAVHSWVVLKPENAANWSRYDVVGWGQPVRTNGWAPDGRWYGDTPRVLLDVRGAQAAALIPKVQAAIADYQYRRAGDYRVWPGPNSNTFVASVLRAMPEVETTLPSNAVGKDFRPAPYVGLTDSRTGIEASLFGVVGVKLGWVEGIEFNFLGLVSGLDLRHPAVKLPGFGRIGLDDGTAVAAAPAPAM